MSLTDDFFKLTIFSNISFRNTMRVSNCLDPDQDPPLSGPKPFAEVKVAANNERVKIFSSCKIGPSQRRLAKV